MHLQALSNETGKWYDLVGFRPDNSKAIVIVCSTGVRTRYLDEFREFRVVGSNGHPQKTTFNAAMARELTALRSGFDVPCASNCSGKSKGGYIVNCPSGGPSTVIHATEALAATEARPLSVQNRGHEFYVAKLLRRIITPLPEVPPMREDRL